MWSKEQNIFERQNKSRTSFRRNPIKSTPELQFKSVFPDFVIINVVSIKYYNGFAFDCHDPEDVRISSTRNQRKTGHETLQ